MADAAPEFSRGTLAYESYAFGWILGEVIRRACGRPIDQFVSEALSPEIPGLRFRAAPDGVTLVARNCWLGSAGFRLGGVRLADSFEAVNNGYACFEALVPGAGMVTNAASLTAFYEMLLRGGVLASGRRLVPADVIRPYFSENVAGRDRMTGAWVVLGRGSPLGGRCFTPTGGGARAAATVTPADSDRSRWPIPTRTSPSRFSPRRTDRSSTWSADSHRSPIRSAAPVGPVPCRPPRAYRRQRETGRRAPDPRRVLFGASERRRATMIETKPRRRHVRLSVPNSLKTRVHAIFVATLGHAHVIPPRPGALIYPSLSNATATLLRSLVPVPGGGG